MRWCCICMPCSGCGCVVTEKHYTAWKTLRGVTWEVLRVLSCTRLIVREVLFVVGSCEMYFF
jgi:hypothetical protein